MLLWWVHGNDREVLLWRVRCCYGGLGVVMAG